MLWGWARNLHYMTRLPRLDTSLTLVAFATGLILRLLVSCYPGNMRT